MSNINDQAIEAEIQSKGLTAPRSGCQGERCLSTDGSGHSRECIIGAGRSQGWTPTAEELAAAGPSAPDPADFPLGKACDLSGEGNCEACQ